MDKVKLPREVAEAIDRFKRSERLMTHIEFLDKLHDLTFKSSAGWATLADISKLLEEQLQSALDSAYDEQQKVWRLEGKVKADRSVRAYRRAQ